MVKRTNQQDHDSMVVAAVEHLIKEGYTEIKADIEGYGTPGKITWKKTGEGHIPDISSKLDSLSYIFEVETDDSVGDSHTEDQWKLFSAHAEQYSKHFIVIVPNGSEFDVHARASNMGVKLHDVWTIG